MRHLFAFADWVSWKNPFHVDLWNRQVPKHAEAHLSGGTELPAFATMISKHLLWYHRKCWVEFPRRCAASILPTSGAQAGRWQNISLLFFKAVEANFLNQGANIPLSPTLWGHPMGMATSHSCRAFIPHSRLIQGQVSTLPGRRIQGNSCTSGNALCKSCILLCNKITLLQSVLLLEKNDFTLAPWSKLWSPSF